MIDRKIIFADDDFVTRFVAESILKSQKCTYYICKDGKEAFDIITANYGYYDLIIADYNMPGLNGCQLYFNINIQLNMKIPFILISGSDEKDIKENQRKQKCYDYFIKKPLSKAKLEEAIMYLDSLKQNNQSETIKLTKKPL